MTSMMRATDELLKDLKLLKEIRSTKGKVGTHATLVQELVSAELRKTHAQTRTGYLPEGTVVAVGDGKVSVIKSVGNDMVLLSDGTTIVNGSLPCFALLWLADSISDYSGGTRND